MFGVQGHGRTRESRQTRDRPLRFHIWDEIVGLTSEDQKCLIELYARDPVVNDLLAQARARAADEGSHRGAALDLLRMLTEGLQDPARPLHQLPMKELCALLILLSEGAHREQQGQVVDVGCVDAPAVSRELGGDASFCLPSGF